MPYWEDNLLALARSSKIDNDGVSSMYKGAFSRFETLTFNCSHSNFSSFPVLNFSEFKPVSDEINLVINWRADISSEKKATGILFSTEIFRAIDSVKAVLPIPGLAAIIIRSLCCHPEVNLSISLNPDGIPLNPSFLEIS